MSENKPLPTSPKQLLELFDTLGIVYELHQHEAVFTVEESSHLKANIPGTHCRNLFLRDKKKRNFLVVAANETDVDLKALPEKVGAGRFSFGSANRLWEFLGVRPGSVCPFAVINDNDQNVNVVLDQAMMEADLVCYHPLLNTMTIALSPADLLRFFEHTGHQPQIVGLS